MTNSISNATTEQPTARGDRDGHRRDVLDAAHAILLEAGWEGLSIRAVASRAGVSTGAVYQWFSGKDEIFGQLMDQELREGLELIDTIPEANLADSVRMMLDWTVGLYERLARYELEFVEASRGRSDRKVAPAAGATYRLLGDRAADVLDAAAARDGIELVQNENRITWFWAGCVGTAERLTVSPQDYDDERREALLRFASESLVRSLIRRDD